MNLINKLTISLSICLLMSSAAKAEIVKANLEEIFLKYTLVEEANIKVKKLRAKADRVFETAQLEVASLKSEKDKKAALRKQQQIQAIVDQEIKSLYDEQKLLDELITKNLNSALAEIAKKNSYDLVLNSSFVHNDLKDITDDVLIVLESKYKTIPKNIKK